MATYTKVSKSVPSLQRAVHVIDVAAGDKIDLKDALGRPARKIIFNMGDTSDVIEYKINHLRRVRPVRSKEESYSVTDQVYGTFEKDVLDIWTANENSFSGTGSLQLETINGLEVESIEIVSLTLASGSTITMDCS